MSFLRLSQFIFILVLSCYRTRSAVDVVKVCSEEQLTLICQSTTHHQGQFLTWNVNISHYNKSYSKSYSITGVRDHNSIVIEPMVTLSFDRISEPEVLPLISQLSINNVSVNLNKTRIDCIQRTADKIIINDMQMIIHIINSNFEYPDSPQVQWMTEKTNQNNVTIILEWMQEAGVSYNVSIDPNPLESKLNGTMSQLMIHYNTSYKVIVLATLCGGHMNMTVVDIIVVNDQPITCKYPVLNGSSLYIPDYNDPAFKGTTVTFNCSRPDEVLIGPNTATCTDGGQWVPDPNQVHMDCKVSCEAPSTHDSINISSYNSTLEGSVITFWCTDALLGTNTSSSVCHRNGNWIPNPASQCTTLDGHSMVNRLAIIAGASAGGAVVTILLILSTILIVGIMKKAAVSIWNNNDLACEVELDVQHDYVVHEQWRTNEGIRQNNIVYADIGPSSADRSRPPEANASTLTLDLDEHRVEYAQLNYSAHSSNIADNSTNEESDISLNLDSLLIQLQDKVTPLWYQFGIALGVEKVILDRCLNYRPEQSIIEILDYWLRNDTKQSWGEVARALRQINYCQMAKEIENIDKKGKFPVEVNVTEIPKGVLHRSDQRSNLADESPPPIPPRNKNGFEENPAMAVVDFQHQDNFKSDFTPARPSKP